MNGEGLYYSLTVRIPISEVCDQVRLISACSATETGKNLEILDQTMYI